MIMNLEQPFDPNQELLGKVERMREIGQRIEKLAMRQSSIIEQLEVLRGEQFQAGIRMGEAIFSENMGGDAVNLINKEIEKRGDEIKRA